MDEGLLLFCFPLRLPMTGGDWRFMWQPSRGASAEVSCIQAGNQGTGGGEIHCSTIQETNIFEHTMLLLFSQPRSENFVKSDVALYLSQVSDACCRKYYDWW